MLVPAPPVRVSVGVELAWVTISAAMVRELEFHPLPTTGMNCAVTLCVPTGVALPSEAAAVTPFVSVFAGPAAPPSMANVTLPAGMLPPACEVTVAVAVTGWLYTAVTDDPELDAVATVNVVVVLVATIVVTTAFGDKLGCNELLPAK